MVGFALAAPGYTLRDVNDWFDGTRVTRGRRADYGCRPTDQ